MHGERRAVAQNARERRAVTRCAQKVALNERGKKVATQKI
jgi:hypothetical protein